jgi:hypothetical protein
MTTRRWEILLKEEDVHSFSALLIDMGDIPINSCEELFDKLWLILHVSDEFKVLAMLKFQIHELNSFGTEISLTN